MDSDRSQRAREIDRDLTRYLGERRRPAIRLSFGKRPVEKKDAMLEETVPKEDVERVIRDYRKEQKVAHGPPSQDEELTIKVIQDHVERPRRFVAKRSPFHTKADADEAPVRAREHTTAKGEWRMVGSTRDDDEFEKEISMMDGPEEAPKEKPQKKRRGLFGFLRFEFGKRKSPEDEMLSDGEYHEEEPAPAHAVEEPHLDMHAEYVEDIKQLSKVTYAVAQKLRPAEMREFKNSQDFQLFKDILHKYKLIKKDESEPMEKET